MTETQRRPVPRSDVSELETATAFLTFARESVLKKTDGLEEEQLRRVLVPTGTNLLGLVRHLTAVEYYWFAYQLAGDETHADGDDDMAVPDWISAAEVIAGYREAVAVSDAAIAAAGNPEVRGVVPVDGELRTLRWILAHMTSETARHAGHADILREQVDGTTGR